MFSHRYKVVIQFSIIIVFFIPIFTIFIQSTNNHEITEISTLEKSRLMSVVNRLELSTSSSLTEDNFKTILINYKSSIDKNYIVNFISTINGKMQDDLANVYFLIVKIPENNLPKLKSKNINYFLDKLEIVIPDDLLDLSLVNKLNQIEYKAPISLINGDQLIADDYKGKGIKIAVLDSGVDPTHPDIKDNLVKSKSYVREELGFSSEESDVDNHGHGTHVSALALGSGVASSGKYIGVAPEASLYNYKVVSQYGSATTLATLSAINDAIDDGVDIITMSLGFGGSDPDHPLSQALDIAVQEHGIHVTVSAGNSGPDKGTISTPSAARSVISIGASYANKSTASFSSRGLNSDYRYDPDVIAPGFQVVSALAKSSITEFAESYYTPTIVIKGSKGDYIPFSGTSMSAPVVAGSLAVLLSKYPGTTPFALRAALMSSADDNGDEEYSQGAGFINLQKADEMLSSSSTQNLFSLLPQKTIFPDNPSLYPGEEIKVNLQFISSENINLGVNIANGSMASMISYNNSITTLNKSSAGYYGELPISFKVPLNPIPGIYEGEIDISIGSRSFTLNIGPITIKLQKQQIAWNIWYTDYEDSPEKNYLLMSEYLESQKDISVVAVDRPISDNWIFKYSTIVLPDIETSMLAEQYNLLKEFVSKGGNVVILSSFYPFTNIDNINTFTKQFGIEFNKITDMNIIDSGMRTDLDFIKDKFVSFSSIPEFNFALSESLPWYGGTQLNVFDSGTEIASVSGSGTVIGGFLGNNTFKGKVIALGSEYWFYNGFYTSVEEEFSSQFFENILGTNTPFVNIIESNTNIKLGEDWNVTIFIGDSNFNVTKDYLATITLPNSTEIIIDPKLVVKKFGTILNYIPENEGLHVLEIEYQSIKKSIQFIVYDSLISFNFSSFSDDTSENIPSYLEEADISIIDTNSKIQISVNFNSSISGDLNVKAVVSNIPEILNEYTGRFQYLDNIYSQVITLSKSLNNTYYEGILTIELDDPVGFYIAELLINNEDAFFQGSNWFTEFFVSAVDPTIDTENSFIDGKSLSFYDIPEDSDQNPEFLSLKQNQELSVTVDSQLNSNSLEAFVLFIPFYPFIDSGEIIDYWKLDRVNGHFEGKIKMPSDSSILQENGRTLKFGNDNLITAILIIIRDSNGNLDLNVVFSYMQSSFFESFNIDQNLIFFVLVIIPGMLILIYYLKGRKRRINMIYRDQFPQVQTQFQDNQLYNPTGIQNELENKNKLNFCPYCGSSLSSGINFCENCGKKITP